MADEEFYLQVENELKAGTKDEALWSKVKWNSLRQIISIW